MSFPVLFGVLALLTIFGYFLGRSRALATAGGHVRNLHSLPNYYGYYIGLWCAVPGFLLLLAWMGFETSILDGMLVASLPADKQNLPAAELSLLINDVKNLSHGDVTHWMCRNLLGKEMHALDDRDRAELGMLMWGASSRSRPGGLWVRT